jgi:hypothetical protein
VATRPRMLLLLLLLPTLLLMLPGVKARLR